MSAVGRRRGCNLLLAHNPSVICFANASSLYTREPFYLHRKTKTPRSRIGFRANKMSVVPPEFTPVFGVHSDPVTGISGGAFPLRGLESAFARLVTGTCTTRPLSWIQNALLFFPQCLYTPFTLSSFQIAVKRFDSFCNYTTKRTQKLRF